MVEGLQFVTEALETESQNQPDLTGNYLRFFISAALSQAAAKQTFDEASTHQHNLYTSQCLGNHQIFLLCQEKTLDTHAFFVYDKSGR